MTVGSLHHSSFQPERKPHPRLDQPRVQLAMETMYEKPVLSDVVSIPQSASTSTEENSTHALLPIDPAAERRLLRKCDRHVLPVISVLYLLAFIDRINIGNAKIQGLEKDLDMTGNDYNIALFVFFIPYILFEVPSNILIRKIAPSTWLSFIMLCWGTLDCGWISTSEAELTYGSRNHHDMYGFHSELCRSGCM